MKLKALVAALALFAAGASMAKTQDLGPLGPPGLAFFGNSFSSVQSFSDTFNFTLNNAADSFGITWETDWSIRRDIDLTSLVLSGTGLATPVKDFSPQEFSFTGLAAGTYSLVVNGQVTGRDGGLFGGGLVSYGGALLTLRSAPVTAPVAAPVPEPETLVMMGLGLGAVAWVARRRQSKV